MKRDKKDKNYIPILDQPLEMLKKPMGRSIDFDAVVDKVLGLNQNGNKISSYKEDNVCQKS